MLSLVENDAESDVLLVESACFYIASYQGNFSDG